jgi:hypothetical protein
MGLANIWFLILSIRPRRGKESQMKTKQIWALALVTLAFSGTNAPAAYNWFTYRHGATPFEPPAVSHDIVAYTSRGGNSKGSISPASMGVFYGGFAPVGVHVGGPAPSGTFTNFGPARVSAFSTAGISGDFNNNGAVDAADYVLWRNAGLLQNDPTPGVQSEDYDTWRANFGQVGDVASAYTVAFHGTYDDPPKSGIFTKRGGQLTTIAKVGDSMPSTGSPIVHVYPDLAISGSTVVFGATDAGGTTAILMSNGGALTTVAKTGDMTSLGPLNGFVLSPAISGNSVAFAATAGDGTRGIFASTGGALTTVFKVGDPAPVGVFTGFFEPGISMGTDGKVAFLGKYDGGTQSGIFTTDGGGELTTVVKTGDVLPGVGASYSLGGPSMAGDEVAFYALVPGGPSAPYPQSTFFLRKGSEPIQRIASVAELLGTSGTSPGSIGMGRFGFSGYRLAFSFDIQINNGVGIIAVRTIPEPATWLFAAVATAFLGLHRKRSRSMPGKLAAAFALVLFAATAPVQAAAAGILTGATLTEVIDVGTARPGIAVAGVHYDPAVDRLFLAGFRDFGTPDANLYEFSTGGVHISETHVLAGEFQAIAGYPGSTDFAVSNLNEILRITRDRAIISRGNIRFPKSFWLAGLALHPATGHLWAAESIGDTDALWELDADLNVLRTVSYASLFPGENIVGLEIDPFTGNFLAALGGGTFASRRIVEFNPGVTTVLSTLVDVDHPGWDSLTSLSIGEPPSARRLYVSSGTSDLVFEFQLPIPEPPCLVLLGLAMLAVAGCTRHRCRCSVTKPAPMLRRRSHSIICSSPSTLLCGTLFVGMIAPAACAQTLEWVRQFGGLISEPENSWGLATDDLGNVYMSGSGGFGEGSITNTGQEDAFLSMFDASGALLWTKRIETDRPEIANAVATDGLGNVYIAGWTMGGWNERETDAYVSKYDAAGTLHWARQFGINQFDGSYGVSADGQGNVYLVGETSNQSPRFYDAFVRKYDAEGMLQWSSQIGGTDGQTFGRGVSADGLGNVYISGAIDQDDAFVSKYDSAGNLQWTRQLGNGISRSVSADRLGNVFVSGPLLQKFDTAGNLLWTKDSGGEKVSADGLGNVYLSGRIPAAEPGQSQFISKYDTDGNLDWTRVLGQSIYATSADGEGNVYVSGYVDVTPGTCCPYGPGESDIFLAKYSDCEGCEPPPVPPVVVDAELSGEIQPGSLITHQFTTSFGDLPVTWSNLLPTGETVNPPTLSESGLFSWQTTRLDRSGVHQFTVSATNVGGSDTGRLTLRLRIIPEPPAVVLLWLGICTSLMLLQAQRYGVSIFPTMPEMVRKLLPCGSWRLPHRKNRFPLASSITTCSDRRG